MCTAICRSILNRMDQCAIQINRMSQCARKTTAAAIIFGAPVGLFTGTDIGISSAMSTDNKDAHWAVTCSLMIGMIGTTAMLARRYLWLFQRTGSGITFCLPQTHAALLAEDVANASLPQDYRNECREYLAAMQDREVEFRQIEQTREYREAMV